MDIILIGIIVVFALFLLWFLTLCGLIMVFIFTPAGTWIKAKLVRRPLICLHFKDGIRTQFVVPKRVTGNFADVRRVGMIELAKDTANFDSKGKLIWYNALLENAKTQQLYKAGLIQSLKETGFKIDSWKDLQEIITMSKDKGYVLGKYKDLKEKDPTQAEKFKVIVKTIWNGTIDLVWNKTYKFAMLYNLFSNDYNPAQVNEYGYLAVMEDRKKRNSQIFVYVILIAILLIVAAIAYTIIKSNQPTQVVVELTPGMLKNGTTLLTG